MGGGPGVELESVPSSEPDEFSTEHLLQNIGRRAIAGGFVTFGAQSAKFLLNFMAAAVLARLLNPMDFGLIGMALGFTGLVGIFNALGLSTATIQRQNITQYQVSNLFWINVGSSAVLATFCALSSKFIAQFYHDPRVTFIVLALSVTFLLTGSTVQHQALLTRQMRFRTLAVIDVTSTAIGFMTACCLAWFGFGYWALVAQQVATAGSSLIITWSVSGWRPSMPSRNSGVKPLVHFGAHLTVADFFVLTAVNTDSILIGRFCGPVPLGYYTRASVLLSRPLQQVMTPINSVLVPVLSRLQNDPDRYRRTLMKAYDTLAIFVFFFSAMCFVLARPLVLVILGPKWVNVIPLFAAYCLVALSTLSGITPWVYESQARGKDQLRNHVAVGLITILAYVVGLRWGPFGLIVSLAIMSFLIRMPVAYYIAGRSGPVSTRDLWMGFLSHLPCWGAIFLATALGYRLVLHAEPILQLLVAAPIGILGGIPLVLLLPRPRRSVFYAVDIIRREFAAKFTKS